MLNLELKNRKLKELIDRYIASVAVDLKSSYDRRRELLYWRKVLGHFYVKDISRSLLVEFRDKIAQGKTNRGDGKRSAATVNRYLAALSHVFTIAIKEWEWADDNPLLKIRKLKEPRGRVRFLSDQERFSLLKSCKESENKYLYLIVVLCLSTGARASEINNLKWDHVEIERGVITFFETKNGEIRAVAVRGHALDLLKKHYEERDLKSNYVFPSDNSDKPIYFRRAWRTAIKRTEIKDFRFHDLRHSAASYLAMTGASMNEIAEVLGHKSLSMVKRYTHLSYSHTAKVIERMNHVIFSEKEIKS